MVKFRFVGYFTKVFLETDIQIFGFVHIVMQTPARTLGMDGNFNIQAMSRQTTHGSRLWT